MIRPNAALLALPLVIAGCYRPPPPSAADVARAAACRSRVDTIYLQRNRAQIYRTDQRDSPYSSNYLPGDVSRGLGLEYGTDRMQSDCVHGQGDAAPDGGGAGPARPGPAAPGGNVGPTFSPIVR